MYNPADTAERIKEYAKIQKVSVKQMLEDCDMNKNVLSTMLSRGSMPKADNIARIADYLDCSVDYLLGRTDNPKSHISTTEIEEEIAKADQVIKTAKYHLKSNLAELQVRRQLERKMMIAKYLEGMTLDVGPDAFEEADIVNAVTNANQREQAKG